MQIILSRKQALKLAWAIFWMATGTSRLGLAVHTDSSIELLGKDRIREV